MISAGRLRFTATIKRENYTDNLGKKKTNFTSTIGTFRCDMEDVSSSEVEYASGVATINGYNIYARWQAIESLGLTEKDRLLVDGKTLRIHGIRNQSNRNRLALIETSEVI